MTYCIVADYFRHEISRGAELATEALIELLRGSGNKVVTIHSYNLTPEYICSHDYRWIIANFFRLSEESKEALAEKEYIIIEHDAKWLSTRDFGLYEDFVPPSDHIVNRSFYEKAKLVIAQSSVHQHAIRQALDITNTVSSKGNPWSEYDLALLSKLSKTEKNKKYAVIGHDHPTKGTREAVEHCEKMGHDYVIIPQDTREKFLIELSKYEFLVFFPQVYESYGRIAAEFRAMNGTILTNKKLGFFWEDHSILGGQALIDFFSSNNAQILKLITECWTE